MESLGKVFIRVGRSLAWKWKIAEADDITNDLWAWYLSRPDSLADLAEQEEPVQIYRLKRTGNRILAEQALSLDVFNGKRLYSSEAVKDALKGRSTNKYLLRLIPEAMRELEESNPGYAEALRSRYGDEDEEYDSDQLSEAHRRLTAEVNLRVITEDDHDGPGSRNAVYPELRKPTGGVSDPTYLAVMALDADPEARAEFYDESLGISVGAASESNDVSTQSLFDSTFNGAGRIEMYRRWMVPDLYPHELDPVLNNWSDEEKELYCGKY